MSDIYIPSGGLTVAARDHGGDGPPVLLLHGAGGNLLHWRDFPERLTAQHRVVSLDLRGHGKTGDGDFTVEAALDDIAAVAAHFGFESPAVVGHSLGGMLAIAWSTRQECPAAISIDGHRSATTHAANYAGMPRWQVDSDLAKLAEHFDGFEQQMQAPLTPDALAAMRQAHIAASAGEEPDTIAARLQRSLAETTDGVYLRPYGETLRRMRRMDEFIDAVPLLHRVRGPVLVLTATRNLANMPPQFTALLDAHRAGLRRDLAKVDGPVKVTEVDASHDMINETGDQVASHVLEFLRGLTNGRLDPRGTSDSGARSVGDPE